jgi:retron-type reverse transcriptase
MSGDLMALIQDLEYLVRSAPYRYKVYEIQKRRSGKMRTIAQPSRAVKRLQHWVIANVLTQFPIHSAALAYRKGKSIFNNAEVHSKNRYLLKLDFKDFFHSIKAMDFERFVKVHLPQDMELSDVYYLMRILFWMKQRGGELVLSIGAPSSPMLSNILMYEFDCQVDDFCKPLRVIYTRYADDLTFSTNSRDILKSVEQKVNRICRELPYPRLTLNSEKTVHASMAKSRRVTGLVLSNDGYVSLGHERKRQLHAALHHFKVGKLSEKDITKLAGMMAYVHSVEPQFVGVLAGRYGKDVLDKLFKVNRPR